MPGGRGVEDGGQQRRQQREEFGPPGWQGRDASSSLPKLVQPVAPSPATVNVLANIQGPFRRKNRDRKGKEVSKDFREAMFPEVKTDSAFRLKAHKVPCRTSGKDSHSDPQCSSQ